MKPQVLFCCLIMILLFSCKKEENSKPPVGATSTKLAKLVTTAGGSTETTLFTYDAEGRIASWRQTVSGGNTSDEGFRIQRKTGGMIDKVVFKRSSMQDSLTLTVSSSGTQYTSAQWSQSVFNTTETHRTTFTYDNAGNITEATITDIYGNGQTDPQSRSDYTYANGNVTMIKVYRIAGNTNDLFIQFNLQYDQKPNPLASGAEWILLTATDMLFASEGSTNNFTEITIKQGNAPERTFSVTYTYNDKDLPVTAVQKSASGQVVATSTYTYQ